jgi:predicted dehydrogenase
MNVAARGAKEAKEAVSAAAGEWASRTLRAGVIGLGFTGDQHLRGYRALPNVQTVALAGLEDEKRAELGATYGVPYLYRDYQELLARDDLDLVSVCTPNALHAPIAIAALEGGRHVICEKPLARTAVEAEAMVAAARANNRVLHTVFNHRARGDVQVLKRHIDEGGLGRIYRAKASWMRRHGIPSLGSWFTNKEMSGGGPLIDLGVHVLDMALHLMGEPVAVTVSGAIYAELGPRGRGENPFAASHKQIVGSAYEVEDLATAFIRFADGATLELEASWATYGSAGDDYGVTLFGTEGGAEMKVLNYGWEDTLRFFTDLAGVPAVIAPRVGRGEGHLKVIRDFVSIVQGGDWANYRGDEGLRRTRIIDACYASAHAGREVVLADLAEGGEEQAAG